MSKIFRRAVHQHALIDNEIPLRRYFLIVGAALFALLFGIDAIAPRQPTNDSAGPRLPKIRIHSEQKGPEAVVIDTSRPIVVPAITAGVDAQKPVTSPAPQLAENVASSARQADAREPGNMERKPQPHRKIARARTEAPPASYARPSDAAPFDGAWAFDQQNTRIRDSFAQMAPRQTGRGNAARQVAWARTEHQRRQRFGWFDTQW